ncbi:hypothetical protein OUZ56_030807 [Daphnia magna]|uniref:Secreted protein n=1 Tax=Daphnia magna TaxID=35525 RepID=A0ABQ9ZSX3_9CRUS|nr:hypothetical protein OUZ56_030807 [Daphnia magna]
MSCEILQHIAHHCLVLLFACRLAAACRVSTWLRIIIGIAHHTILWFSTTSDFVFYVLSIANILRSVTLLQYPLEWEVFEETEFLFKKRNVKHNI